MNLVIRPLDVVGSRLFITLSYGWFDPTHGSIAKEGNSNENREGGSLEYHDDSDSVFGFFSPGLVFAWVWNCYVSNILRFLFSEREKLKHLTEYDLMV
jgi:hypothetical protein